MAQKTRLLGQNVQIRISRGGVPETTITAIKNFTFSVNVRVLTDSFLGETGNRQDSIFDDISGSFTLQPEDPAVLVLQKAIADKAIARRAGEQQITVTFRCVWPSGKSAKITIPEMEFEAVPFNVGARDAYVDMTLSYKAERYTLTV